MIISSDNQPFRVGVVGLGFGAAVHIPAFRKNKNVEVVVVAGTRAIKAKGVAKQFGINGFIAGYQSILDFNVDIVSIALPPKQNYEATQFFLENKIAVICEKPISQNISEANNLVGMSKDIPNAVNFQFAELDAFKVAKKIIEDGELGKLQKIEIKWVTQSYANKNKLDNWKRSAIESGGVISLLVTHSIYLLKWFRSPILKICSSSLSNDNEYYTGKSWAEDTCQIEAKLISGEAVEAYISNNSEEKNMHKWEFHFEDCRLILKNETNDYMSGFEVEVCSKNLNPVTRYSDVVCEGGLDGRIQPFSALVSRFLDSIIINQSFQPSLTDALLVQKCSDAIFQSHFDKSEIVVI